MHNHALEALSTETSLNGTLMRNGNKRFDRGPQEGPCTGYFPRHEGPDAVGIFYEVENLTFSYQPQAHFTWDFILHHILPLCSLALNLVDIIR